MPDYFPPLPPTGNPDQMVRWLEQQTISVQKLIGGTIQAVNIFLGSGGVIASEDYNGSSTGWAIFGDGSASFYGDVTLGANAIITGDLYSSNWDGTIPANLATVDTGASVGYYLDSSVGSAQFMGDLFVGGDISLLSGGSILIKNGAGDTVGGISLYTSGMSVSGDIFMSTTPSVIHNEEGAGTGGDPLYYVEFGSVTPTGTGIEWYYDNGTTTYLASLYLNSSGYLVSSLAFQAAQVLSGSGSASAPAFTFSTDTNTGFYRVGANNPAVAAGGSRIMDWHLNGTTPQARLTDGSAGLPALTFISDANTGFWRPAADQLSITLGGATRVDLVVTGTPRADFYPDNSTLRLRVDAGGVRPYTTTTGSAANLVQTASGNLVLRSTSSARWKTAIREWDGRNTVLDLTPVLFRSKAEADDGRKVFLGLLAEDVADHFPMAAIYDEEDLPESVNWNAISTGIIAEIRSLHARLELLESSLAL